MASLAAEKGLYALKDRLPRLVVISPVILIQAFPVEETVRHQGVGYTSPPTAHPA